MAEAVKFRKEWCTLVDNIKAYGTYRDSGEGRRKVLEDIGSRIDQKAEYVIISG